MATYRVDFEGYAYVEADSLEEAQEAFKNYEPCNETITEEEWQEV